MAVPVSKKSAGVGWRSPTSTWNAPGRGSSTNEVEFVVGFFDNAQQCLHLSRTVVQHVAGASKANEVKEKRSGQVYPKAPIPSNGSSDAVHRINGL
jgi:hypothetical protein